MRVPLLLAALLIAPAAHAACTLADVDVKLTRARWVDNCRRSPCPSLVGAGVVTSRCAVPVAVQVRIVGLAKDGTPVAVRELWPFSTNAVPAGAHPFSIDTWLDHDPEIVKFSVEVVKVRQWGE